MKASPLRFPSCQSLTQIVLILALSLSLPALSAPGGDICPPTFLTAVGDQDGNIPLFWFCPHPETLQIAYHGDEVLDGVYVVPPWRENCVAVKISSPSVPFHLLKSKIYVCSQGSAIDTSYNLQAPFFVAVNRDSGGVPEGAFTDSVWASAGGDDSASEGQWVYVEHDLLMQESVFWIVFHWQEDSPMSPLVGEDDLPNGGNSYWGKRTFFHFEWHQTYHNLMIRAEIAINGDEPSDVDSFKVYRSDDPDSLIYQSNVIGVVPGLQFQYTDWQVVQEQTYFYRVISFNSEGQSRASNLAQATPTRGAQLDLDKETFVVYSTPDQQVLDDLTLSNSGELPLTFRVQIDMEGTDWMGGSDPFGYTWTDNAGESDLEFSWVDIEERGVSIGEVGDDNLDYGFFELGFSFPFYDDSFDCLRIASDGWLSFSDVLPCYTDTFKCYINRPLPWLWGPYFLLAPFWDDLELVDSSAIYFYSNSDSAIVSFISIYRFGKGGPYTFQTILTPDGEITYQYLHIPDSLYSATAGIQNGNGTTGLAALYDEESLHDSLVIKIRPSWIRLDSMSGCIQPGQMKTLNLTFDPVSYPRGIYQADLLLDSWDKNHQLETEVVPLTLCLDTTTSVEWSDLSRPERITLFQNYPNPFNPATNIQFTVGISRGEAPDGRRRTAEVSLRIYNLLGQLVRTLADQEMLPGSYRMVWDGKDDKGRALASGIYFCRLTAGSSQETRKMVLLK